MADPAAIGNGQECPSAHPRCAGGGVGDGRRYFAGAGCVKYDVSATQRDWRRASKIAPSLVPGRSLSASTPRSEAALARRSLRFWSHLVMTSYADTNVH